MVDTQLCKLRDMSGSIKKQKNKALYIFRIGRRSYKAPCRWDLRNAAATLSTASNGGRLQPSTQASLDQKSQRYWAKTAIRLYANTVTSNARQTHTSVSPKSGWPYRPAVGWYSNIRCIRGQA